MPNYGLSAFLLVPESPPYVTVQLYEKMWFIDIIERLNLIMIIVAMIFMDRLHKLFSEIYLAQV